VRRSSGKRSPERAGPRNADSRVPAGLGVFLNIPYDAKFTELYLAYIAGTAACGLVPTRRLRFRAALPDSGGSLH